MSNFEWPFYTDFTILVGPNIEKGLAPKWKDIYSQFVRILQAVLLKVYNGVKCTRIRDLIFLLKNGFQILLYVPYQYCNQ